MAATNRADGLLAQPALAEPFAGRGGLTRGDCIGEIRAQIKIAPDAFLVQAVEGKHRLRVVKVHNVFDLAALGDPVRVVIREIHRQRLQFRKRLRESG